MNTKTKKYNFGGTLKSLSPLAGLIPGVGSIAASSKDLLETFVLS